MSLSKKERDASRAALNLAMTTMHDPAQAAASMPRMAQLLGVVDAGMQRRTTWQRIMTIAFTTATVTSAAPINAFAFTWPKSYHLVGIKGALAEGTANLPNTYALIARQDGYSFFVDQKGNAAYVSLGSMQGNSVDNVLGYYPIDEYVQTNEPWNISLKTTSVGALTPEVTFLVEPWDPVADPRPAP